MRNTSVVLSSESVAEQGRPSPAMGPQPAFSPPVERALATLRGRAGAEGRGQFFLDGRPTPLRAIIREANRVRARLGHKPIAYPGEVATRGFGR